MKKQLLIIASLAVISTSAQSPGDYATLRKGSGLGDVKTYHTPVANSLFSLNGSSSVVLLPKSTFALSAHAHVAANITDFNTTGDGRWALIAHTHAAGDVTSGVFAAARLGTGTANATTYLRGDGTWSTPSGTGDVVGPASSTADNVPQWSGTTGKLLKNGFATTQQSTGSADGGKVVRLTASGGLYGVSDGSANGVNGVADSGDGVRGDSNDGDGGHFVSVSGNGVHSISAGAGAAVLANNQGTGLALEVVQNGSETDLASFTDGNDGLKIRNDGGLSWTSATGALTTRTELGLGTAALADALDFADAIHAHNIGAVVGLQSALDLKLNIADLGLSNAGTATTLQTGRTISIAGDLSYTSPTFNGGSNVSATGTLATVNSNVGTFGSTTDAPSITVNGKGLVTAVTTNTITPALGSITGLGTGVGAALGTAVGTAGGPVTFNGALGTPSSAMLTNATGLPLTTGVTGILPVAKGGTGVSSSRTMVVPITANAAITWTDMPAAVAFFNGQPTRSIYKIDLSGYTQCRIVLITGGTAAASTGRLLIKYKTGAYSTTIGDYSDIGTGAAEVAAAGTSASTQTDSGWISLTAAAQADVQVAVMGLGSNGINDPIFGNITIQFR